MFCPKCGSILMPKKIKGKAALGCSCGYTSKDEKHEIKEVLEVEKEIEVLEEGQSEKTLPITKEQCPKCKNNEARYWLKQMRAGDEPESQFFKCTKCSHTWKEK